MRTNIIRSRVLAAAALFAAAGPCLAQTACGEWQLHSGPNPDDGYHHLLRAVKAFSPAEAWAVGESSVTVQGRIEWHGFAMRWDGVEWVVVPTPNPGKPFSGGTRVSLEGIDGVAPDDLWVVGSHEHPVDPGSETLAMHWDGSDWTVIPSPRTGPNASGSKFLALEAIATDNVWAVGDWANPDDPARGSTLAARWDGSEWTVVPSTNVTIDDNELRDIDAAGPDEVWAVGGYGVAENGPLVLRWDGNELRDFHTQPDVNHFGALQEIEVFGPDDVWVSGTRSFSDGGGSVMIHWDGSSWTGFDPAGGAQSLAAVASDDIWSASGTALSHWNGVSWELVAEWHSDANDARVFTSLDASGPCEIFGAGLHAVQDQFSTLQGWFSSRSCTADFNADGQVNTLDVLAFLNAWSAGDPEADFNADGQINTLDVLAFLNAWSAGC